MMKMFFRYFAVLITVILISTGTVFSQITMERWVIGSGGMVADTNSTGIEMSGILGQFAIETVSETNGIAVHQGFWAGFGKPDGIEEFINVGLSANLKNYPNPVSSSTTIEYTLPSSGFVTVKVYDMMGRVVKELMNEVQAEGLQTVFWDGIGIDGQPVPAGTYLYELTMQSVQAGSGSKSFQHRNMMVVVR